MADLHSGSWLNSFLPIITLIIGLIVKPITDWIDYTRTREHERDVREETRRDQLYERRNTFQRQTLLDLQEANWQLLVATTEAATARAAEFKRTGSWTEFTLANSGEQIRLAIARAGILEVRVSDKSVRELMEKAAICAREAFAIKNEQHLAAQVQSLTGIFDKINERIGDLLLQLDEIR
jgi:hypothetical protein